VDDGAVLVGQDTDGDVEAVGEGGDAAGAAVGGEVREDADAVAAGAVFGRVGVFDGAVDPKPAAGVEGEVDRLLDVRLGGDQLRLEAGRQLEGAQLVGRGAPRPRSDQRRIGAGRACGDRSDSECDGGGEGTHAAAPGW